MVGCNSAQVTLGQKQSSSYLYFFIHSSADATRSRFAVPRQLYCWPFVFSLYFCTVFW